MYKRWGCNNSIFFTHLFCIIFCSDGGGNLNIYYISDRKESAKVYAEIYLYNSRRNYHGKEQ